MITIMIRILKEQEDVIERFGFVIWLLPVSYDSSKFENEIEEITQTSRITQNYL